MPTYAYECEACGHGFEVFQSMTARSKRKCPECGKNKLQRLIGKGAAILFKGDGFYETDYRSDSYKSAAKSESTPDKGESKKADSEKSGSTKPEAKSTDKKKSADP